jgi:hypothetical protein
LNNNQILSGQAAICYQSSKQNTPISGHLAPFFAVFRPQLRLFFHFQASLDPANPAANPSDNRNSCI